MIPRFHEFIETAADSTSLPKKTRDITREIEQIRAILNGIHEYMSDLAYDYDKNPNNMDYHKYLEQVRLGLKETMTLLRNIVKGPISRPTPIRRTR